MALCWGRHFRSCSSPAILGRRASQSVSLHQKPGISLLFTQMTVRIPCRTGGHELISRLSTSGMFYAQECKAYKEVTGEPDNYPGRPEKSQLKRVSQILAQDLPRIFSRTLNYSIYHPNIAIENNIRGTKTVGLINFTIELLVIRLIAHFKFSSVTLNILKITEHIEDGTVRVRWRAEGIPMYSILIRPFKASSLKISWYDGFSTYYVHSDGLVHKLTVDKTSVNAVLVFFFANEKHQKFQEHQRAEERLIGILRLNDFSPSIFIKMMPDSERKVSSSFKSELAAKVAFAIGISLKDLSVPLVCCQEVQEQLNIFKPEYPLHVNRTFF